MNVKYTDYPKASLLLEDGTLFEGTAVGKIGTTGGEICFNTGMTGYQEIYTDPSYFGQIIINTTPHVGNYGVNEEEQESDRPKISGVVIGSFSRIYSRNTANDSLDNYFVKNNTVGICDLDTRKIVRHIRDKGAMNAVISSESSDIEFLKKKLSSLPSMVHLELSSEVSTKEVYEVGDASADIKIAVLDLGIKRSILKNFTSRGVYCKVFPARTKFSELSAWNPDGYFISNGPGDPSAMAYAVETVSNIIENDEPVFGICLGHQILSIACGATTFKMHNGHRGCNHPVKNLESGLCEVTSQNHGFAVDMKGVESSDKVTLTHINLNDDTVAGIKVNGKKAFSVQYHPESSPGPHDSRYLFDQFIEIIQTNK